MLRTALKECAKSTCTNQHGSVVCKGKRVLGKGHNSYRSHPRWGTRKVHSEHGYEFMTIHAEAAAIRDAVRKGINVVGATIYVTRTGSRLSKPCNECQIMIESYGIRKVVYTDSNGNEITTWPL